MSYLSTQYDAADRAERDRCSMSEARDRHDDNRHHKLRLWTARPGAFGVACRMADLAGFDCDVIVGELLLLRRQRDSHLSRARLLALRGDTASAQFHVRRARSANRCAMSWARSLA